MLFKESYNDIDLKDLLYAGIDEVGRGSLAGPVCAAAVILPKNFENEFGIKDSKKLTEKKRLELFDIITKNAISYSVTFIDNSIIDKINILQATQQAMHKAIDNLIVKPEFLLIDGNYFIPYKNIRYKTVIKGDSKNVSIAAASIIAKVSRDNLMKNVYDAMYPQYNFKKNVGYGTKEHLQAIEKYGPCEIHRKSFLKCKKNNNNLLMI